MYVHIFTEQILFKYSFFMFLSIKMELKILFIFETFNLIRNIFNFVYLLLTYISLSGSLLKDFWLCTYYDYLWLSIIKKLGLRMSNYNDNQKYGINITS